MRRTKIVCTLGPSTDNENTLRELIISGMNVARFNFSHGTHEYHKNMFQMLCRARDELKMPIAAMLDTKGPEVRLKNFAKGKVMLEAGKMFTLTTREVEGDETIVSISYKRLPQDVHVGSRILIDDGLVELTVISVTDTDIVCEIVNGGPISNHKGVNLPDTRLTMPYMSEADRQDIIFGIQTGYDFIAASFVRCADDVMEVRHLLHEHGGDHIKIIAKIENSDGVENIDEILHAADGIMVARGDMGVEIDLKKLPAIQKQLIKKAYRAGKIAITATQMLDSMIKNPRPTRAETTDVANAIYDGTSAIMLSGETAAGMYPVQAVKTMAEIAEYTECDIDYKSRFKRYEYDEHANVTHAISQATVTTAHTLQAKAIITVTESGKTARMISKFRPVCPIISGTCAPQVYRQMALSWGVIPIMVEEKTNTDELFQHAVDRAEEEGLVQNGDLVVITAGVPLGVSGTTNLLKVHIVGNILASGTGVTSGSVCANLCVCKTEDEALKNFEPGDILVIPQTGNKLLQIMKDAAGIITELDGMDTHAAIVGMTLEIPVIVGAANATSLLKNGVTVVLDASRGIVCSQKQEKTALAKK